MYCHEHTTLWIRIYISGFPGLDAIAYFYRLCRRLKYKEKPAYHCRSSLCSRRQPSPEDWWHPWSSVHFICIDTQAAKGGFLLQSSSHKNSRWHLLTPIQRYGVHTVKWDSARLSDVSALSGRCAKYWRVCRHAPNQKCLQRSQRKWGNSVVLLLPESWQRRCFIYPICIKVGMAITTVGRS